MKKQKWKGLEVEQKIKVKDLEVGDKVDLKSCPYLHDEPSASFEYAEVVEIEDEEEKGYGKVLLVSYDGISSCGYAPEDELVVMRHLPSNAVQFFTGKE